MGTARASRPRPSQRSRRSRRTAMLPWVCAIGTIISQIAYPLLDGEALRVVTITSVMLFFLASVTHALAYRGWPATLALVAVTAGGGLLAESVGVRTGIPFGEYDYTGTLGPQLVGVPVVVPLAWTMMAYPAFVVARALTTRFVPLVGGVALASWDLFLDPQMVAAGFWTWDEPEPSLPGIEDVPISNFIGWLAVAVLMMVALEWLLPREPDLPQAQPAVLFLWTWAGSIVGNLVFFGRPAVALVGGAVMGLVAVPYVRVLWRRHR